MKKVEEFIKNPKKALFKLAGPIVIAMFVQTLYNIVDTAYVGRLGAEALAAVTFSFPLFFLLIALDSGIGAGMGSRISRFLGEKNKKQAENTAMHGLYISLAVVVFIFIIGSLVLRPLLSLFGAEGIVLDLAYDYMSVILIGMFFMFPAFLFNNIFSSQGDTKTPMKIQITALILNVILDPIFIFVLDMGVKGAAVATSIAFFASLIMGLYYLKKVSYLHIHPSSFKFSPKILKEIFFIGLPASLMMIFMSVYVIFINRIMITFGTEYVAMFGVIARLDSVAVLPMVAISFGLMTLVGMFTGAKRFDLVKNVSWFAMRTGIAITLVIGLTFLAIPSIFLRIFTPDMSIISIGKPFLRIEWLTYPTMVVGMMTSRIMQGMGYGLPGLVINLVRIFVIALPLALIFVFILNFSYLSMAWAMVLGGLVSSTIGIVWLTNKIRKKIISS